MYVCMYAYYFLSDLLVVPNVSQKKLFYSRISNTSRLLETHFRKYLKKSLKKHFKNNFWERPIFCSSASSFHTSTSAKNWSTFKIFLPNSPAQNLEEHRCSTTTIFGNRSSNLRLFSRKYICLFAFWSFS